MALEITIRAARETEISAILRLWQESGATPSLTDSAEALTLLMREPTAVLLVAIEIGQDRVVGSVIGGWDGWRGNIYRLAVLPEYRRKGIAQRLVQDASRALFDKGARRISALVEHDHPMAVGFWNSMRDVGYALDPRMIRFVGDRDWATSR